MKYCFVLILIACFFPGFSQEKIKIASAEAFQEKINADYKDPEKSPLLEEDLAAFEGLEFFSIDTTFAVTAEFVRTPSEEPFYMPTTTTRQPVYVKYGELHFKLKGEKHKLNVYQNLELVSDPEYADYLFLPFTDYTNGVSSYGGGRYLDLRIPSGSTVELDFNKAYNPYCAYNPRYSCPIPPAENDLKIEITAGVKAFDKLTF